MQLLTLAINNQCNAGDLVVWGDLAEDGFECDADCVLYIYERQDDENVQEGQIGYLCTGTAHVGNYRNGSTPFKPVTKRGSGGKRGPYKRKKK
jgi:hypothetical protein